MAVKRQGYRCAGCGQILELGADVPGIIKVGKRQATVAMHAECLRATDSALTFADLRQWAAINYGDDGALGNVIKKAFGIIKSGA